MEVHMQDYTMPSFIFCLGKEIEHSRDREYNGKTTEILRRMKLKFFCRIVETNNPSESITTHICTVTVLTGKPVY